MSIPTECRRARRRAATPIAFLPSRLSSIDEFVRNADGDVAVAMVERQTMLKQFPDAQRTRLRFSDGAWSDPVAAIDVDKLSDHLLAEKILAAREARNGDIDAA